MSRYMLMLMEFLTSENLIMKHKKSLFSTFFFYYFINRNSPIKNRISIAIDSLFKSLIKSYFN